MLADFLILSNDLLTVPDDQILSVHPLATYVGGRKVLQWKAAASEQAIAERARFIEVQSQHTW